MVMSATLDTGLVHAYLAPCPVLGSPGACIRSRWNISHALLMHGGSPSGTRLLPLSTSACALAWTVDILVFMPGTYEIMRTIDAIGELTAARGWTLLPLYGELPPAEQDWRCGRPLAVRSSLLPTWPRPPLRLMACVR